MRPNSSRRSECNVTQKRIAQRRIRFLQDIFTTLVDSQWRWTLIVFALSFVLSWLGFAVIWWLIAVTHGDLEEIHLPPKQRKLNDKIFSEVSNQRIDSKTLFSSPSLASMPMQRTTIGCRACSTFTVLRRVFYFQSKRSTQSATVCAQRPKNVPKPYLSCAFNRFAA